MEEIRAKRIIEDIARRVYREEKDREGQGDTLLRRRIKAIEDSQTAIGGTVGDTQNQVNIIANNPPEALNKNVGFMVDSDGDGLADDWSFGGTATVKSASIDTTKFIYGPKSQKLTIGAGNTQANGTAYIKQTIAAEPNRAYCLSLYYCGDTIDQMSYECFIRKHYSDLTYVDVPVEMALTANWERRWVSTIAESNITTIDIYVGIKVSQAGIGANAWFDAVILNGGPFPMPIPGLIDGIINEDHVDHVAPPNPTLVSAQGGMEVLGESTLNYYIDLTWTPITDPGDFKCYNVYIKETGAANWILTRVVNQCSAGTARLGGLKENTSYSLTVTSEDIFGNEGEIGSTLQASTPADLPPGNVGAITANFTGIDCQLWWDEVTKNSDNSNAIDIKGYVVEVYNGATLKRTEFVTQPQYVYTLEKNIQDNTTAIPNPNFKVYAKDIKGQLSITPAASAPINVAPSAGEAPSAVAAFKVVVITCPRSSEPDVRSIEVFHSLNGVDYSSLGIVEGTVYVHKVDCQVAHYYKYKYIDAFGQASSLSPAVGPTATTDGYISEQDMAGTLFQIEPSSSPAPSAGILANLYDGSSATSATFGAAGYVEYKFPVEHVFNKVIVELDAPVNYYVTYYDGAQWVEICGTAVSPKNGTAGRNTETFTSQIRGRRLRFNFLAGCTIKELKFSSYLLADELDAGLINLAKALQIYNNDTGSGFKLTSEGAIFENGYVTLIGAGGTLRIDEAGLIGINFTLTDAGFRLYSTDNNFEITPAGLMATDPANVNKKVKLDKNGFFISTDGGTTWQTAITADGIEGQRIKAGTIQTNALAINVNLPGDVNPAEDTLFPFDGAIISSRGLTPGFNRDSVAYLSDGTQVAASQPRFETGKFGKAVMVEEGTTNLLKNASFETGITNGWTVSSTNVAVQSTEKRSGSYALRITDTSTTTAEYAYQVVSATAGTVYTLSAYAKMLSGVGELYLDFLDSTGARIAVYTMTFTETTWTRKSITQTAPTGTASVKVWLYSGDSVISDGYWDDIQLEAKFYPMSVIYAADITTESTRSPETLTIPASVLNPQEGTIECYVNLWRSPGTNEQSIFDGAGAANQNLQLAIRIDGKLEARYGTGTATVNITGTTVLVKDTWYHVACKWTSSGVSLFLNGAPEGSSGTAPSLSFGANSYIGSRADGTLQLDGLIDSLRISKRAYTDAEIAAHAAATSPPTEGGNSMNADLWPIRAAQNQIWIDGGGLNMKNAGVGNIMMNLNAERLGFWDPNGLPTIGIGAVSDMAAQLGSDMDYGLLLAQGEVRATQAVLRQSLADYSIGQSKVEDGTMTLSKLSELISVTIPDRLQREYYITLSNQLLTNPGFETGDLSGWGGGGTISSSNKRTGSYCLYVDSTSAVRSESQQIAATAGNVYRLEAYIQGVSAYIKIEWRNSGGGLISSSSAVYGGSGTSFTLARIIATAPANTAYLRVVASVNLGSYGYFDDFALYGEPDVIDTSYATYASYLIPRDEAVEQIKIIQVLDNPSAYSVTVSAVINGVRRYETVSSSTSITVATTLDVRAIAGDLNIKFQAKSATAGPLWTSVEVLINQRLPLRAAEPRYAVTNAFESSCGATCEKSCQTGCQTRCESSCQSSCQTPCQSSCQSTCQLTSQGGGCFVEGTFVSIYDAETEEIREVPIESLEPGMLMPAYNPATDNIEVTECVSNIRSKTGTLYVIEIEGGHVLRATGEQPFDVLRPNKLTGQLGWCMVQARYLEPGDMLVRPFDQTDRLPKVLKVTETIVPPTWVWNPRTASKRYIVEGFADAIVKY